MRRKEDILKLRSEGKSYREIEKILGCSKSVIYFHCNNYIRTRNPHPFSRKIEKFSENYKSKPRYIGKPVSANKLIYDKIQVFLNGEKMHQFTLEDVIAKFGESPVCYLTGTPINIHQPKTYQFDHIIPRSRGGQNSLDNLEICTAQANRAKFNMTPDEFINLCQIIVDHNKQKQLHESLQPAASL